MNKDIENYLKKCKNNFDNDVANGWWKVTPKELSKNKNLLGPNWKMNHIDNPEYFNILYGDIKEGDWEGKTVLDYGCGFGGNLQTLGLLANWGKYIGYEISKNCVEYTKKYLKEVGIESSKIFIHETNGYNLSDTESNSVDFVTSIVVLQHVALHQIKYKIFEECYRVMKDGGIFSFQMNASDSKAVPYRCSDISSISYSRPNCRVDNPELVVEDLKKIGFSDVTYQRGNNPALKMNNGWVYFKAIK